MPLIGLPRFVCEFWTYVDRDSLNDNRTALLDELLAFQGQHAAAAQVLFDQTLRYARTYGDVVDDLRAAAEARDACTAAEQIVKGKAWREFCATVTEDKTSYAIPARSDDLLSV